MSLNHIAAGSGKRCQNKSKRSSMQSKPYYFNDYQKKF